MQLDLIFPARWLKWLAIVALIIQWTTSTTWQTTIHATSSLLSLIPAYIYVFLYTAYALRYVGLAVAVWRAWETYAPQRQQHLPRSMFAPVTTMYANMDSDTQLTTPLLSGNNICGAAPANDDTNGNPENMRPTSLTALVSLFTALCKTSFLFLVSFKLLGSDISLFWILFPPFLWILFLLLLSVMSDVTPTLASGEDRSAVLYAPSL